VGLADPVGPGDVEVQAALALRSTARETTDASREVMGSIKSRLAPTPQKLSTGLGEVQFGR